MIDFAEERRAMRARARRAVFGAVLAALAPTPDVTVSAWAEQNRQLAAGFSPLPGKWRNSTVPYLVELMEVLSLSHPAKEVVFRKSAQVAGTEAGINLFGTVATMTPTGMLIVLPTVDEAKKYNHQKLQPAIDATPLLRGKVFEIKSRDEKGSTTLRKAFPGGFCIITGANSSAGLQMISVRVVVLEEVSEFPWDVDGRGDPVDLAIKRTTAYDDDKKLFFNSTPAIKGLCRIDAKWEVSDQRRFYVPCPHCAALQVLNFDNMRGEASAPYRAHFTCIAAGCIIEPQHKAWMVSQGVWIKTFDGGERNPPPPSVIEPADVERWRARDSAGRQPGFAIWQAYSPFVSWDTTWKEVQEAKASNDKTKLKVATQQVLGEAFEETGESLDETALAERRIDYPQRTLPKGALVITAGVDVQDNRLEIAVWAWGPAGSWLIDTEVVLGVPDRVETWAELNQVLARRYPDANGRGWPIEQTAIDTGGHYTHQVYAWARGRPGVKAIKGVGGPLEPPLGRGRAMDINDRNQVIKSGVMLYPVGQHGLKDAFHSALGLTLASAAVEGEMKPGAVRLGKWVDKAYIEQLTSETLIRKETGAQRELWVRRPGRRNEGLDNRVYAEAMAHHLGVFQLTPEQWEQLAATRGHAPDGMQEDLFAARLVREVPEPPAPLTNVALTAPPAAPEPPPAPEGWLGSRGRDWFSR